MYGDSFSILLLSLLTILAVLLTVFFGYMYHKDKDERKLMFVLAFALASLAFLPKMQAGWESMQIAERVYMWSPLPILVGMVIVVLSSLLEIKGFAKPFKAYLFIFVTSILMIVIPIDLSYLHSPIFTGGSVIVLAVSSYLITVRREISDLMFLLSMICFISGGLGMSSNLSVEFCVLAYIFAYVFIALVFTTTKEGPESGISSFFALKRELEKTREALKISQQRLVEAERMAAIGETAAMVGHDLRNPLQAITNAVYYLKKSAERAKSSYHVRNESPGRSADPSHHEVRDILDKCSEMADIIDKSVKYADKIVSDLQDYAQPVKLKLVETDLRRLIDETLSATSVPENIRVSIAIDEDSASLMVDSVLMKRAFTNLVTNAVQAMPNGGKLTVRAARKKDAVLISVEDTGIGIPEENLNRIFEPLFTTKAKGQGLGLPVCKRLVEAHGGVVKVESKVGEGSTFTIELPVQRK